MVLITLIGETQARIGNRFYFLGPQTECRDCRLKGVCFNLETGRLYEVTNLRDTHHDCEMHESGVRVVEVEKKPALVTVPKKLAIDGSMITFESRKCSELRCEYWQQCHPLGIKDGEKLPVVEVEEDIPCDIDEKLTLIKLG
ncbi:MAG: UPF0179 family protein [Candidatus Methanomethylophilaceae archaeon]